jgi:hypothetical protein
MGDDADRYHAGRDSWFTEGTARREHHEAPARSVHEPARETPVHDETAVLVVGGGPAGCAARGRGTAAGRAGDARRTPQPPRRALDRRPGDLGSIA